MRSILLYHVYPVNHWQEITEILFQKLPFHKIVVHVSLPNQDPIFKAELELYLYKFPIDNILYSPNSGIGEVDAMKRFVATQQFQDFDLLTYMHCKGVTKPGNQHILNWTKLMRYFIIEEMDACYRAFRRGFVTFGINKSIPNKEDEGFRGSSFYYEGNFVSLNLKKVDLGKAVEQHLEYTYYGLEGFWGKLCNYKEGYSLFKSGVNHYLMSVPQKDYATPLGRLKYSLIRNFYNIKSELFKAIK